MFAMNRASSIRLHVRHVYRHLEAKDRSNFAKIFAFAGSVSLIYLSNDFEAKKTQCKAKKKDVEDVSLVEYRNRTKHLVTLDQIFNANASVERNGEMYLTRGGFLQCILNHVYTPIDKEEVKLKLSSYENPHLGAGHSHLVSKTEFKVLVKFLAVPIAHLEVAFSALDADESGTICKNEFIAMVERLIPDCINDINDPTFIDSLFLKSWFGEDGSKSVSFPAFKHFIENLKDDINNAELKLYSTLSSPNNSSFSVPFWKKPFGFGKKTDEKTEYITRKNLALTFISSTSPKRIASALLKIHHIEKPDLEVPLKDAILLQHILTSHCDQIMDALVLFSKGHGGRGIDFKLFERAVKITCEMGESLHELPPADLLLLVFKLWDKNNDGFLDLEEIENGIKTKRNLRMHVEKPAPGVQRFISCVRH